MPKATIVTLMCNRYELTNSLLFDLFQNERDNIGEVIVVDNHSTDTDAIDGLVWWRKNEGVIVYEKAENSGFTLGANTGLRFAVDRVEDDTLVFLISNDVRIHTKFIQQATDILSDRKHLIGNSLVAYDSGWNKFGDKIYEYLDGSFLVTTAAGWKELGFFDEAYAPGDFEDIDLSTLAKTLGYKLVALNNPSIHHLCAGTRGYSPEREVVTRRNQEYFRQKWIQK